MKNFVKYLIFGESKKIIMSWSILHVTTKRGSLLIVNTECNKYFDPAESTYLPRRTNTNTDGYLQIVLVIFNVP